MKNTRPIKWEQNFCKAEKSCELHLWANSLTKITTLPESTKIARQVTNNFQTTSLTKFTYENHHFTFFVADRPDLLKNGAESRSSTKLHLRPNLRMKKVGTMFFARIDNNILAKMRGETCHSYELHL